MPATHPNYYPADAAGSSRTTLLLTPRRRPSPQEKGHFMHFLHDFDHWDPDEQRIALALFACWAVSSLVGLATIQRTIEAMIR